MEFQKSCTGTGCTTDHPEMCKQASTDTSFSLALFFLSHSIKVCSARSIFAYTSGDMIYSILSRISLEFGSSAQHGMERGLLNEGNDVETCPNANVSQLSWWVYENLFDGFVRILLISILD